MTVAAPAEDPHDQLVQQQAALIQQQQRLIDQLLALHQQQAPKPPIFQYPQPNVWTTPAVHTYTTGSNIWPMTFQTRPHLSP